MDVARVRWAGGRRFVGTDEHGHSVVMDARPEYKGEGSGFRPVELVLHALGGCTAMDIVSVLEKKRQDVRDVEVRVTGTQREDEFPHIYDRIEIEYIVSGYDLAPAAVERAIQLSEEKYCSVKGMLGPQVSVTTSYFVREARPAGASALDHARDGDR